MKIKCNLYFNPYKKDKIKIKQNLLLALDNVSYKFFSIIKEINVIEKLKNIF